MLPGLLQRKRVRSQVWRSLTGSREVRFDAELIQEFSKLVLVATYQEIDFLKRSENRNVVGAESKRVIPGRSRGGKGHNPSIGLAWDSTHSYSNLTEIDK